MRELQGRRQFRRLLYSKTSVILLLVILVLLGRSTWSAYQKNNIAEHYRRQAEAELGELVIQKKDLVTDVSNLKTKRGIEEAMRVNYPVIKPGEKVIAVLDPEPNPDQAITTGADKGFWYYFKSLFVD